MISDASISLSRRDETSLANEHRRRLRNLVIKLAQTLSCANYPIRNRGSETRFDAFPYRTFQGVGSLQRSSDLCRRPLSRLKTTSTDTGIPPGMA